MISIFNLNSAKSFVGRTVNLHLKDGDTLVCVKVKWARKTNESKHIGNHVVLCCSSRVGQQIIPLWRIAYAETVQILEAQA